MGKKSKLNRVLEESKKKVNGPIPVDRGYLNDHILFSWKYLCTDCDFSYEKQESKYFVKLIGRFHDISTMKIRELLYYNNGNKNSVRFHRIDFAKTIKKQGFELPDSVEKGEPYQFEVSQATHGRVHGFFIGNTFYIVWLDPKHKLYPTH